MSEFLDRISKLSPQRLALLADELNERVQANEKRRHVPLAIVGIGCRLPGGVHDPDEFWKLLSEGVDAVTEVPISRWNTDEFYDRNPDTPGKMATHWGAFIEGPEQFDPKFFGIAPAEATSMDPQQRLLLETAWEALEHGGIAPSRLAGTQTGVFVGICNGDYSQIALNSPRESITPYFAPGLSHAVAAGRISYVLGLQGPSLAVDTSCSASLVAVHLACQSLRLGECDTALAGGVNLILNPDITIALSQSRMMAPDGRCKAFSDSANGFVRGEGCGMIVLKRLPDAIRDRNRVLAVIRGSACNQDGRSSGLTAPNGPSQEAVVSKALSDAGLRPEDIDYIEAHGTGTSLGDPIEAGALNAVFSSRAARPKPLFVGSVKTNLGHLESAAGIAGLIKLVLSIQQGQIPATLHLDKPSSRIEWDLLPLKVPTKLQSWKRSGKTRIGGVSSFGFSGTNCHVIVEEYQQDAVPPVADRPYLFTFSAKSRPGLQNIAARFDRHLVAHPSLSLADAAYTLNAGRSHFEHRAAIAASSHEELQQLLGHFSSKANDMKIQTGRAEIRAPRVAFVFGAQSLNGCQLSRELFEQAPVFRDSLLQCEQILKGEFETSLTSVLYPQDTHREDQDTNCVVAQRKAVTFALQYALAELWRACGIEPAAVLGFGVGEYVAACVAGVLSVEDALRLAISSGEIFDQRLLDTSFMTPRISFLSNAIQGTAVNSPDYWRPRQSNETITDGLAALQEEGLSVNLFIGNAAALAKFAGNAENDLPGKWLSSLGSGVGDRRQFLHTAAALYVMGCELDIGGLYRDAANTISLPTYPFDRERYWLDFENEDQSLWRRERIATSPKVPKPVWDNGADQTENTPEGRDGWVYELAWEPKPLSSNVSTSVTACFDEDLIGKMSIIPANAELLRIEQLTAKVFPVYATYILQALQKAGLSPLPTTVFTMDGLRKQLKIIPARYRVFERLLEMLVEDKILHRNGEQYKFVDFEQRPDADREVQFLAAEFPECRTEMDILRRCGKKLLAVLQGTYDPMQLVFADGSIEEAEQIYANSPVCRFFNDKATQVVRSAVDPIVGRPARILEIGGGTGATTMPILSGLTGKNFEYTFTDVSAAFLPKARSKFSHVPSMVFRVLDIERDPLEQRFETAHYDVIIAANVLHATADMRRTIAHARKLLAPGGVMLLIEGVRPDRWLELTFGLTDGWWRFVDFDLRPAHPLISAESWAQVFRGAGMSTCRSISYRKDDGTLSQQVVIVSQVDAEVVTPKVSSTQLKRNWTIFADQKGIGEELKKLLVAEGQACELIPRPNSESEIAAAFRHLQKQTNAAEQEIVYLWSIDAELSGDKLTAGIDVSCKTLVHLIQSLQACRKDSVHLWIGTRGAQPTGPFSTGVQGPIQSLAWGIGRSLGLEAPDQLRKLIDLDPAQSSQAAAACLLAELQADDTEDQIAYHDNQRLVARLQRSSLKTTLHTPAVSALREDGTYLIVGGLGGVGLRLAAWAAEQGARHITLLSRTGIGKHGEPLAAERFAAIEKIKNLGVAVTIVEGDVATAADMKALFRRFNGELPALHGVLHAATEVSAAPLASLTDEQLTMMLRSKVEGTWQLHQLTKTMPLDFFLVFSSTTSLLGAKGMAHYAAANQFLDTFAHYRRAAGLPMLAVNWGAWDVMRQASQEDRDYLNQSGIFSMESDIALSFLTSLVVSHRAQIMIANIDWSVLKPLFELHRKRPLLEKLGNERVSRRLQNQSIPQISSLHAVLAMQPEERRKFIESFVVDQAGQVLGFHRDEVIRADVPLPDLGLDSLMAVDLKNRLQTGLGQELSPTIVFDYSTVGEMAAMLDTMLWATHGDTDRDPASQKDEILL